MSQGRLSCHDVQSRLYNTYPSRAPPPKPSVALLGVECRWDKDRAVTDPVTRRTARKTLRNALKRFTPGCRENRNLRLGVLCARLHAQLRGDYHASGGPGNSAGLTPCFSQGIRILKTWLTRRSQRRRYTWAGDPELLAHVNVGRPRIVGQPTTRRATSTVSAGWRTRVDLQRPVREHRPPGSGRGRSGHWPSYRDGHSTVRPVV